MDDYRDEIPTRSFINAGIIYRAVVTKEFQAITQHVMAELGMPGAEYLFKNPAYISGLLYCMIVVPKEIWYLPENHAVYKLLDESDILDLFDVTLKDAKFDTHPMYYLIHRLRNAIVHANFSINQAQDFSFWDRKSKSETPNWTASISNANLFLFLSQLGHLWERLRKAAGRG